MKYLIALLAGALLPLALAPFDLWPLGMVSVAAWFWTLQRAGARDCLVGWLFGVGKYAVGASWIYVSIHVYGYAPPPLAAFLVALFVAGMGLFTVIVAVVFARLRTGHPLADAATFAVAFVAGEWLLTWLLTGFPWLFIGYGHLATPLSGLAPLGGVLLVSLGAALSATMSLAAWQGWRAGDTRAAGLAAMLTVVPWLTGGLMARVEWVEPVATRSAALVQGNVDQSVKWDPVESAAITRTYLALNEPQWDQDLIIWPEAAITRFEHEVPELLAELDVRGKETGTTLLLGLPYAKRDADGRPAYFNAVVGLGAGSGRYLKRRLVPFGEYVPLESWLRGLIAFFDLPMSGFSRGPEQQAPLTIAGQPAVMAICYEIVYPELVREGADAAAVLLTVSNDTWFGASVGPLQHLEMARMRALENGRWLLRATNNGVTAVVDAQGQVRARLPQFAPGVLRSEWQIMRGSTPYTRFGYLPVAACVLLLLAIARVTHRQAGNGGILPRFPAIHTDQR